MLHYTSSPLIRNSRRREEKKKKILGPQGPNSLKDMYDSNEWLTGRIEEEEPNKWTEDDLVLIIDDDYMTWVNVSRAAGVEERFNV